MYISNMRIYEKYPTKKIIRDIPFKMGLNLIVDNSDTSGNNVGKTTALKLIDICLGAKNKKYIYVDSETNNENLTLKNYIEDYKVSCELTLTLSLNEITTTSTVEVELFSKGKRYFDGEHMKEQDYLKALNKVIFYTENNIPTFRSLIGKFVRINQKFDDNKFLKYIDFNVRNDIYISIYNFLFKLIDDNVNATKTQLESELHELKKNMQSFKKMHKISNIDSLIQELNSIISTINHYQDMLNTLTNSQLYKQTEFNVKEIKVKYTLLTNKIEQLQYEKERIEAIILNSSTDKREVNYSILKELYNETSKIYTELNKQFEELIHFNKQLSFNKLNYYNLQLEKKNNELVTTQQELDVLFKRHSEIIMLIKQNNIEEYQELQLKISQATEKSGGLKTLIQLYKSLDFEITQSITDLEYLELDQTDRSNQISKFNKYFTQYSKIIADENYFVYLNDSGFPISINNSLDGLGTGSKKALITIFDLAYISFVKELNISAPKFVVHDVIESVETDTLTSIIEVINSIDCQYIVAVLNEKIKNIPNILPKDKILELTKEDRLFKI